MDNDENEETTARAGSARGSTFRAMGPQADGQVSRPSQQAGPAALQVLLPWYRNLWHSLHQAGQCRRGEARGRRRGKAGLKHAPAGRTMPSLVLGIGGGAFCCICSSVGQGQAFHAT